MIIIYFRTKNTFKNNYYQSFTYLLIITNTSFFNFFYNNQNIIDEPICY